MQTRLAFLFAGVPTQHLQPSPELTDTAPLIRAALVRLNGRSVLITTADDAPIVSGRVVILDGMDGPLLPSLALEFNLRGITFSMEIPLGSVFTLVSSWTGNHFVFRLSREQRLAVEWPRESGLR
jgi:hypothetical protein